MKWRTSGCIVVATVLAGCGGEARNDSLEVARSEVDTLLGIEADLFDRAKSVRDEMERRQELVVDCMRELGFTYVAWVPPDIAIVDPVAALPADEYAEVYGLGISTRGEIARAYLDAPADPNLAIQEALSQEELNAYRVALSGSDFAGPLAALPTDGCMGDAAEQVRPPEAVASAAELTLYFDLRDRLNGSIRAHEKVQAALGGWRGCMSDHGFSVEAPDALADLVYAQWLQLAPSPSPAIADPTAASALPRSQLAQFIDPARLDELMAFERSVAMADRSCSHDLELAIAAARAELEPPWIEFNRELLQRVRGSLR